MKDLKNQLLLVSLLVLAVLLVGIWAITRGLLLVALIMLIFVCLCVILLNIWFWQRITEPIDELTKLSRRIASGTYGVKVGKKYNDEVGRLSDELNIMSEKVAIAEKSRTDFISQVSHELRTPLTAIQGWSETIAFDPAVQGDSLRGVHIISKEAERLTGMVSEMLEFARIQDGRFNLRVSLVDIAAELEDALFTYGELMKQAGIQLNYTAPESDIPLIPADSERLKQVFLNLLDNAAKHGGDGKKVDVSLVEDDSRVEISFRDYGKGIPTSELPHVKEKFYKGSSKNRGTGIGLAVCDEIVARHGGELTIRNADGSGCIVTITLPCQNGEKHVK